MNLFVFFDDTGRRMYWRGPEETTEQAISALEGVAGIKVTFMERLK
jgi:hypothetical protein